MRSSSLVFSLLIAFLLLVGDTKTISKKSDLTIEFDDSNIQPTLEKTPYSFIYFYSDSCKYCTEFDPEFEKLSVLYKNLANEPNKLLQVLKTNARKNKRISELFQVSQYPTLKLLDYDTKEIISYNGKARDLGTLIQFLKDHVPTAEPNFNNFESQVQYLDSDNFDSFIRNSAEDTLVVFTLPYLSDWSGYEFPFHFYQRLAHSDYKSSLNFALVDVDKVASNQVIARYKISNFPSLIYFSKSGKFKAYQVASQNHLINDRLNDEHIRSFLDNLYNKSGEFGQWFDSQDELETNLNADDYNDLKHITKYGFNFRQNDLEDNQTVDLGDEYEFLLNHIEL